MATRATSQAVQVPGDSPAQGDSQGLTVEERLAQLEAENARLKAAAEAPALPSVVYEPTTPHGAVKLAESATGDKTVAQVMALIDAGKLQEPVSNYLCKDGYYTRRTSRGG